MTQLGENIRRLREKRGMSQKDLAVAAKVSQPTIADLENGKQLSSRKLPAIAKALGVTVGYLDTEFLLEWGGGDLLQPKAKEPVAKSDNQSQDASGKIILEYDLRAGASYGGGYALTGDNNHGMTQELVKGQWVFPESWLRGEMRLNYRSTDIIAVDGPSMLPDLCPGDRVLIDRSNRDCKQDAIFAIRDGESVIIKHVQLIRNTDPPRIICRSSNENYEPFELVLDGVYVEIIGRVAAKISRM